MSEPKKTIFSDPKFTASVGKRVDRIASNIRIADVGVGVIMRELETLLENGLDQSDEDVVRFQAVLSETSRNLRISQRHVDRVRQAFEDRNDELLLKRLNDLEESAQETVDTFSELCRLADKVLPEDDADDDLALE